jgi:hypothetical protein
MITWGQLAKSQTDPEKIEEAIKRLINEHNADPEAHLVEGGSLKSHKMAEIIDHLVESIVADKIARFAVNLSKMAADRIYVFLCVLDPSEWDMTYIGGAQLNPAILGSQLYCPAVLNSRVKGVAVPAGAALVVDYSKDILLQCSIQFGQNSGQTFFISVGAEDQDEPYFRFKVVNNKIYGQSCDGEDTETTELLTLAVDTIYVLRAEFDSANARVMFYINEVLKAIHSTYVPSGTAIVPIEFELKNTDGRIKQVVIHDLVASFGR